MNELIPALGGLLDHTFQGLPYLLPELILVLTFVLVILVDLFAPGKRSTAAFVVCLAGMTASVAAGFLPVPSEHGQPTLLFGHTLWVDGAGRIFKQIFYGVTILFAVFLRCNSEMKSHSKGPGDFYILLPAILLALNLMSMASSLLLVYLSIEMVSIASYLAVGYVSGSSKQTEAAMKYVLFGSACSAVMLYGMSMLYGFTGTLNVADPEFVSRLAQMPVLASSVALGLVLVGVGFKLSFVPMHFWSPDVYEGAPTPVTAFLSTGPKIAGFALLMRLMTSLSTEGASVLGFNLTEVLSCLAILSMVAGNFAALWQENVKRMLAYSSIGHTGFILLAVVAHSHDGLKALLFYVLIYAVMNMAAFMIAGKIEEQSGATRLSDYRGLGKYLKLEMVCFTVVLVSLTGLPPLAGFIAKFLIFSAIFEAYTRSHSPLMIALLVTGAVTTVVSLFYYFKIPLNAFLRSAETEPALRKKSDALTVLMVVLTALLLLWGVFPGLLI